MKFALVLRIVAIVIAVASAVDPALERQVAEHERITVVAATDRVSADAERLRDSLSISNTAYSVYDGASAAAACPSSGACVLVTDGVLPERVSAGARLLGVLSLAQPALITRIDAPGRVHREGTGLLRVHTQRPVSRIDVFDDGVLVGTASPQASPADVAVVPVAAGARALRVVADGEESHTAVIVDDQAVPVLFYEPQATWLGTFVRRGLEDDARFSLKGRTRLAPPVSIARGNQVALNDAALEELGTVVVTAPEMLSVTEVDVLERFVTDRGGSLILLADRAPSGPVSRLLPAVTGERRDPQPRTIGPLRATEWLTFAAGVGVTPVAAVDDEPVIAAKSIGRGRVIVSGALDAWRYRDASQHFATFWSSLVWDAAALAGPRLRVELDRSVARPGQNVRIFAELQTTTGDNTTTRGVLRCGDEEQFVRLWPHARPGTVFGTVRHDRAAECSLRVTINGIDGNAPVTFRDDWRATPSEDQQLEALAAAYGAPLVEAAREDELVTHVRTNVMSQTSTRSEHPLRSPWWLVPFALCLGGEWWLRRQVGLS